METAAAISASAFRVGSSLFQRLSEVSKRASVMSTRGLWPMAASGSATTPQLRREYQAASRYTSVRGGSREMRAVPVLVMVLPLHGDCCPWRRHRATSCDVVGEE